jgi:sugar/nucleoside kinase (ribokinase family)
VGLGAYAEPVIVIVGTPIGRLHDQEVLAAGTTARAALAAALAGRTVQLIGRTGDDPAADALLLSLAHGGVGHAALLRDPAHPTPLETEPATDDPAPPLPDEPEGPPADLPERPVLDAADVELGLRYLTDFAVVVLAEPAGQDVVQVVADAARWNGAQLLVVVAADAAPPDGLPPDAIVFEAPADDRDGVFAMLVGRFAAALDNGADPAEAFRSSVAAAGWTESAPD